MTEPDAQPISDPVGRLAALPTRVLQIVVSPGRLFEGLRTEPRIWGALILGAVLLSVSSLLLPLEVWEATVRNQVLDMGQDPPVDLATVARVGKVAAVLGSLVVWPVMTAITAGLFALIFLFVLGYEGTYRQYLSITAHAFLIVALAAIVLLPLRVFTQDAQLSLTLGSLLPWVQEGVIARFLGMGDLFNLWAYGLVGFGAAVVDEGRAAGVSVSTAVGAALLVSLLIASLMG